MEFKIYKKLIKFFLNNFIIVKIKKTNLETGSKFYFPSEIVDYIRGRARVYLASERFEGRAEGEDFNEVAKEPFPTEVGILFFRLRTENKGAKVRFCG